MDFDELLDLILTLILVIGGGIAFIMFLTAVPLDCWF